MNNFNEALADSDKSLELHSQNWKALRTRARIHLQLEKFDACISDYREAIQQANMEGNGPDAKAMQSELKKAELALKRSKTKDYYKILGELHSTRLAYTLLTFRDRLAEGMHGGRNQEGVQARKPDTSPR